MFSFAVIADLHLPDRTDTCKERVLDWALAEARRQDVSLIACAGDLTSIGTVPAAERFRAKLDACGIPFLICPGNAELRRPRQTAAVLDALQTPEEDSGVLMLDSSRIRLSTRSRNLLERRCQEGPAPFAAVTHCPLSYLPNEDQTLINACLSSGRLSLLVTAHIHKDVRAGRTQNIRGIDPDKAIGGAAALSLFSTSDGIHWKRQDIPCPLCNPDDWTRNERHEWLAHLGICGMDDNFAGLTAATSYALPFFELRCSQELCENKRHLQSQLASWRAAGGRLLSMHLPSLNEDPAADTEVAAAAALALELQCERVTVHVPVFETAARMENAACLANVLERYARVLSPLSSRGVIIGIENMHLKSGNPINENRPFGCTPPECRSFVQALATKLNANVGFHLDIGHARNNLALASRYNLTEWYAEMGDITNGYHIHQLTPASGKNPNHSSFINLFDAYIPLGAFMMAWHENQLNHAPIFLEVQSAPPIDSFLRLYELLT